MFFAQVYRKPYYTENTNQFKHCVQLLHKISSQFTTNAGIMNISRYEY